MIEEIINQFLGTTWLEAIAVITGIASVIFALKEKIWVFPTGIISVSIYIYICYKFGIYADMGVNIYYLIMSIYGWILWSWKKENVVILRISKNNFQEHILSLILLVIFFFTIRFFLLKFTNSTVPNWDAFTSALACVGMWLMAKKKIENWIFWILTDLISIPLYYHKGLAFTSVQFLIFTFLAISGFLAWRNKLIKLNQKSQLEDLNK